MSRSSTGRPSSSSRIAPPTIQAYSPPSSRETSSSIGDDAARPRGIGVDAAGELVPDRAGDASVLVEPDAGPDARDRGAGGELAVELDGEGVQRDRADHAAQLPRDTHLSPGQVAPEAVRVADRDDADPRRLPGDVGAAVTPVRGRVGGGSAG